jgi:hypothetical protein
MNRNKYAAGHQHPYRQRSILPGQIWQMKADVFAKNQHTRTYVDFHILISKVDANGNVTSHLVHYVDHDSLNRETMWAAQNSKREALEKGHKYLYPGTPTITIRLFHREYILENYDLHDQADYLLEHVQ